MKRAKRAQKRQHLRVRKHVKGVKRRAVSRRAVVLPLKSYRITAGFGQVGNRWSRRHTGLDMAAPLGTPVRAVSAGTIISAGWGGPYGNRIKIRHADGTQTWYCHLSAYVRRSGRVAAGQVIGRVGSTGNSTGPHLHLEVRPGGGAPVNPLTWLRAHGLNP
ncbi:Peptidase M23 [Carbonactinospora thermoautotrophica]|uniref:Peptidase M23 n=1 Tax=Carbonactinospora thermoautotrophica TaxID=1469144 RepID=A0A132MW83_9ACTN|nr:Peptidase M23 [Carbonactinospora thermoautotrophica]